MIDTTSKTTTTKSTRRRSSKNVLKTEETVNGDLSNGSPNHDIFDRSWISMNHSDYLDYRRRKSGSFDTSRVSNSTDYEEGSQTPGFISRFYKKFGFYWNVFPKTDYCYLPTSPDYQKEVSPGIPMVPNLSRDPLPSFIKRHVTGNYSYHRTHEALSRVGFSDKYLMSSTKYEIPEVDRIDSPPSSAQQGWHLGVGARKSLSSHHTNNYVSDAGLASWSRRVTSLTKSLLTIIRRTTITTITTVTHLSASVVPSNSDGSRSCNWLPLFLFLLLLLPFIYYLFAGVVGVHQGDVVTAVSSPASDFFSSVVASVSSMLILVKEALLFIPTIYFQIAALFTSNSSSLFKSESPCTDSPAHFVSAAQFPVVNWSSNLTEESLLALQTEIIEKLKTDIAGQNYHITAQIERIQEHLTNLTDEMKKISTKLEGGQRANYKKLEGELTDIWKAVIDVKDQAALGNIATPSDRMVERAVAKYHADRTGKPDYALQSSGGFIVRVRCTQTYTKTTASLYVLGLRMPWDISNGPETILRPGVLPGECWAFEGSFAQITIHLATKVKVTSFSLEHSPKELALHGHISSAPKDFSVWAVEGEYDDNPRLLGKFIFLDNGESLQHFDAIPFEQAVELIELKIESNHGNPEYTCVYRIRVHGVPSPTHEAEPEGNSTGLTSGSQEPVAKSHSKPYR